MRLRQIEVFHAIYSSGSMTNAAALLNVSQPSVSKVLAHAEQQLGYRLFDRVKGKLIPTPEAHQLFTHVKTVYEDVDRLRHIATNIKASSSGRIRIAGTPAFGLSVLPESVATFRQQHDSVVFEIETLHLDEMMEALLESRVDIGLAFNPVARPGIKAQTLARGRFVVLAPSDSRFEDGEPVSIRDIAEEPFIALNGRGPLGQALSDYMARAKTKFDVVAWTETYHVAKAMVACGVGTTIADDITARSLDTGDVKRLPLTPALRFDVKALHVANAPLSIAARNYIKHLGTHVKAFLNAD
ncbi:MAG: LysR family transcriptional regulator [Pseudomonadota bacterium]